MKRAFLLGIVWLGWVWTSESVPYHRIRLDGYFTEYDAHERRATFIGSSAWGDDATVTNLYITWDKTYLYVGLQGWENGNKLVVLIDVDPDQGTGATTFTNWTAQGEPYIRYNDYGWVAATGSGVPAFGADYMIASEGYYHDVLRITYDGADFDTSRVERIGANQGPSPSYNAVDIVAAEGLPGFWRKGIEARIPWSALYYGSRFGSVVSNEIVPRGARLRVLAGIHNNNPNVAWSSPDTLPQQEGSAWFYTNGLLITDTYLDIDVDVDHDGIPDGAETDVNGPFLVGLQGRSGGSGILAVFNEPVIASTVSNLLAWSVSEGSVSAVSVLSENECWLHLDSALPSSATMVQVSVLNVVDLDGNTNSSGFYFYPVQGGLETGVIVRFLLQTQSGLGLNPGASNFFVNGSALPLEWGYPPETTTRLWPLTNGWYYRDVFFPPGTPTTLWYKYSGQLGSGDGKGTNNYEAVRLHRYNWASRRLTLPDSGALVVVTDYLGAAAHPWRDPNAPSNGGYNALYWDLHRGDAGVRTRVSVLFQLDLSKRDRRGISRVLLLGSDPLRGFNVNNESPPVSDYPTAPAMSWDTAGLTLYDDGTHGDLVAGDGIYSRRWIFSTTGYDEEAEPTWPHSLVGGGEFQPPYYGENFWAARRSPRSFAYKFAVYKSGTGEGFVSPTGDDLEYYIEDAGATNLVLPIFEWDNNALPFPPPSNAPTLVGMVFSAGVVNVIFTNHPSELQHGLEISTNLLSGWMNFGHRATSAGSGYWQTVVRGATAGEAYRCFAGPAVPARGARWSPNPLPETGGVLHIEFCQHSRATAGDRALHISGTFNGWSMTPMTFVGDGTWIYDLEVSGTAPDEIQFKIRDSTGSIWEGMGTANYRAYKGFLRASWTPEVVTNGGQLTIQYDATGGPLETSAVVQAHVGYDESWAGTSTIPMTNIGERVWTLTLTVPTNYNTSVNFVFTDGTNWDSEYTQGRVWRVFIAPQ